MNAIRRFHRPCSTLFAGFMAGCAMATNLGSSFAGLSAPPLPSGWAREVFPEPGSRCSQRNCHSTLKGAHGTVDVTTRAKEYARHDIPGWNESKGQRVANGVAQAFIRGTLGGSTDERRVGVGTRVVAENVADGWRLKCTVFWVANQTTESSSAGDQVNRGTLLTQGLDCAAAPVADSTRARWHFTRGVAPPFDSVATVYDSLTAEHSPLLGVLPPMTLERLATDGQPAARYDVVMESLVRLHIARPNREPFAQIHNGISTTLDLVPTVTEDEGHVARLIAAVMAIPLR